MKIQVSKHMLKYEQLVKKFGDVIICCHAKGRTLCQNSTLMQLVRLETIDLKRLCPKISPDTV